MNIPLIRILAFPDAQLLDVAGPFQVFAAVNAHRQRLGEGPAYAIEAVADAPCGIVTSSGLGLMTGPLPPPDAPCDTLIVAGGKGTVHAVRDKALLDWLRRQAASARRTASVCTGAFLLAEAGLLDGLKATTHWRSCPDLARRYPAVTVDPDPIFIRQGAVWTSAGVTAGMDLALALVADDLGSGVALTVARDLVVFLKRPGTQAQFSAALSLQQAASGQDRFADLHGWMQDNLAGDLSVAVLAVRAGMSERSFQRHYRALTGESPARAVLRLKVEAACRLLAESRLPLKRIAKRCGFGSEETLRRSFSRAMSVTPQDWRDRFGAG